MDQTIAEKPAVQPSVFVPLDLVRMDEMLKRQAVTIQWLQKISEAIDTIKLIVMIMFMAFVLNFLIGLLGLRF